MTLPVNFNTPDRIMKLAGKDAGLLQEGDEPSSEQTVDWLGRLIDIINFEQTQGLKLFLLKIVTVPLVANKSTYTLMVGGDVNINKPLRIISAYYKDINNNQRPLIALSWDEYTRLSNTVTASDVNSYFVDKQAYQLNLSIWNTPNAFVAANGSVYALTQTQVDTPVATTDTLMFPMEWFIFLRWALASDICSGQPQAIMDRCTAFAEKYRMALDDWDVEDASTMMTPDSRDSNIFGR